MTLCFSFSPVNNFWVRVAGNSGCDSRESIPQWKHRKQTKMCLSPRWQATNELSQRLAPTWLCWHYEAQTWKGRHFFKVLSTCLEIHKPDPRQTATFASAANKTENSVTVRWDHRSISAWQRIFWKNISWKRSQNWQRGRYVCEMRFQLFRHASLIILKIGIWFFPSDSSISRRLGKSWEELLRRRD